MMVIAEFMPGIMRGHETQGKGLPDGGQARTGHEGRVSGTGAGGDKWSGIAGM